MIYASAKIALSIEETEMPCWLCQAFLHWPRHFPAHIVFCKLSPPVRTSNKDVCDWLLGDIHKKEQLYWYSSNIKWPFNRNNFTVSFQYITISMHKVYILLFFVKVCNRWISSITFRVTSLALEQIYNCPNTREAALKYRNKSHGSIGIFM